MLLQRATLLTEIRAFFQARGVLEVETPIMSLAANTDPNIHSLGGSLDVPGLAGEFYLQTSPEFAMKRLLAAGSGPIFQMARVFRARERGSRHNPEFTLLEWYRPTFDHHQLMDEMDVFLQVMLGTLPASRTTYTEALQRHVGLDAFTADTMSLRECAVGAGLSQGSELDREALLDFLMSTCVIPHLGHVEPVFIHDYPASQAALARLSDTDARVAERFEVFIQGMELANGFHELTDAREQAQRFQADRQRRVVLGLPDCPADERLIAALRAGLPPCAGVALGVDRLLMLRTGAEHIDQVLTFAIERA